ncbi:hypothetical protein Tco_0365411 [Tanacetum coccineum]
MKIRQCIESRDDLTAAKESGSKAANDDNSEMLNFKKAEEENEANKQRLLEIAKDDKKKYTSMASLNLFEDHSYDSSNYTNVDNFEALDYEDAHHGMSFEKTPKLHF